MKAVFLFFAIMLIYGCSNSIAQRLRTENFNITTVRVPVKPLPEDFKTYQAIIYNRGLDVSAFNINPTEVNKFFQFDGLIPVQQNGDLIMLIYVYDVGVRKAVLKQSEKDKSKGINNYWYEQNYNAPIEVSLTDRTGNVIYKKRMDDWFTYKASNTGVISIEAADSIGRLELKTRIPDFVAGKWRNNLKVISSDIRDLFDYQRTLREIIYYRPKKSDETDTQNTDFFNSIENAKRAYAFCDNGFMNETVRTGLKSSIKFWDTKKDDINLKTKDDKRMYYACAFNAANSYFQLNDFDKALSYVPLMTKVDIDNGEAEAFAKAVNAAKLRLWQHNDWKQKLKSGQVSPYLSGFLPSQPTSASMPQMNISPRGYIVLKSTSKLNAGAKKEGTLDNFLYNMERMRLKIVDNNGKESLYFLEDVQEIRADDMSYRTMRYPTDIFSNKTDLVQVVYETSRIGVYRAFESVKGVDGNNVLRQGATLLKKGNEEKYVNLNMGSFVLSFNARLSEYLEDCLSVSTKARNGQYSLESVRTAAMEYDNCNN